MAHTSQATIQATPLLTKAAKLDVFTTLFGGKLSHPGTLFLPKRSFYDKLATDAGLVAAARELYRWLGVKPRRLAMAYGDGHKDGLSLAEHYRELPYQVGALLALHVVRDVADHLGYPADDDFIEFASLESGLGVLVINGLYQPHSVWEGLVHAMHGHWYANETVITHAYHPNNYANELLTYADAQQLSRRLWAGYLHAEAQRKLGVILQPAHRELPPTHELLRRSHARTAIVRLLLLAVFGGLLAITATYVTAQRPRQISTLATEQYQEVMLRKQAYIACVDKVTQLMRDSENNDIFTDQELNAQKSRCLSLQNTYNAAVSRYNATLTK